MTTTPSGDPHPPFISDEIPLERASVWEAILGILAVGVLYAALPSKLIIGPSWLLLVIEGVLLLPLVVTIVTGRGLSHSAMRVLILILLGVLTLALAIGVALDRKSVV